MCPGPIDAVDPCPRPPPDTVSPSTNDNWLVNDFVKVTVLIVNAVGSNPRIGLEISHPPVVASLRIQVGHRTSAVLYGERREAHREPGDAGRLNVQSTGASGTSTRTAGVTNAMERPAWHSG